MKTEQEVRDKMLEIEADERLSYSPAKVEINAPLALEQMGLEARAGMLKWVLDD